MDRRGDACVGDPCGRIGGVAIKDFVRIVDEVAVGVEREVAIAGILGLRIERRGACATGGFAVDLEKTVARDGERQRVGGT